MELKYQKDIKDKKGEHYYVGFTICLKNLEKVRGADINDKLIQHIIEYVRDQAPVVHQQKDSQRKKIDNSGKKRKYCRYHPVIELDLDEFSLDPQKKVHIKQEYQQIQMKWSLAAMQFLY